MMYAKLKDGRLQYARSPLVAEGVAHFHPSAELYHAQGYLEVVEAPRPDTDRAYMPQYTEHDGKLWQEWIEADQEESGQEPDLYNRVEKLEKTFEAILSAVPALNGILTKFTPE